jgi:hypothetical protein
MSYSRTRSEVIEELRSYNIKGPEVYMIDIIPLIEMIWADGIVQKEEISLLYDFLEQQKEHPY